MSRTKILIAIAVTAALVHGRALQAQTPPGKAAADTVEEVVITAAFKEQGANDSMKMGIPVRDTPLSIESYTGSFMKSIETLEVADLYRYMTGLQKGGITGYDLTIRGFSTIDSDRNTFLTDGLPGLSVRFGSPPTIGTEHIELVKGAASLLYGQAQPGGFVNVITKKPQATPFNELEVRGTENASDLSRVHGADVSLDSTGPLGSSGRVLYRVVGQLSDDDRFHEFSYERGQYLAPSLTVRLGEATTATAQFEYRSSRADYENVALLAPWTKPPAPGATVAQLPPIQTSYAPRGSTRDERGTSASLFLKHAFGGGVVWNGSVRSVDHHDYAYAFDVTRFDTKVPTLLDLRARGQSNQRTYNFADTNLVLPFNTGGVSHRVIVGLNYGKEIDDFRRTKFCAINSPGQPKANASCNIGTNQYTIAVINPDFSAIPPVSAFGPGSLANNYIVSETQGAYLSDLATLTKSWKLMAGLRYSRDKLTAYNNRYVSAPPSAQTLSTVMPQVGLIFQPSKQWSYYASYSTSYTPVDPSTQGLSTSPTFEPTKGVGGEVGAKANFLNGRVDLTAALFTINQKNVLAPYPGGTDALCPSGGCSIQVGAARSKGAELELDAKPIDQWTLIAGYAYTDARVTESTSTGPLVGNLLPNSPFNAAHLWSRYDFLDGTLQGYGAGLGYSYVSSRVAMTGTATQPSEFNLPAYQVFDLAFYKNFGAHFDLTLKVNNLFDKRYYQDGKIVSGMVSVDAGLPRTAELYLRARL
ncbi:MAG: TonB-dependent receptor [Gammaproteobacteria bacterium]|nr:TonB-dependent receptor [Gammaproteobacteria bacterium]